jgi:transposase-like protein
MTKHLGFRPFKMIQEEGKAVAQVARELGIFASTLYRWIAEYHFSSLTHMHLTDYKVRVPDECVATVAKVRVLIESAHNGYT